MELFIESPQRVRERLERERRALDEQRARAAELLDLDEPDMGGRSLSESAASAAEAYQAERAYDRRRARRRKLVHALRLLGIVVAVPFAVVAVFLASYALTYILNGASPEEVAQALFELMARIKTVVTQVFSSGTA